MILLTSNFLFVYGTLRRASNHPMHKKLANEGRFYAEAELPGLLYEVNGYPGAIYLPDCPQRIKGELHRIDQKLLSVLDQYEECTDDFPLPHEYKRSLCSAFTTNHDTIAAWVYLYNYATHGLKQIESGDYLHFNHLKEIS
jgi:gamma-glutamylcyclotransferase (GGCT)/AIG2-like uncharacterized protein YtfP